MQATECFPETRGAFVENQDNAALVGEVPDRLQETVRRWHVPVDFHLDHTDIMVGHQSGQPLEIIVLKRKHRAGKVARDTGGAQPGKKLAVQIAGVADVRRQIPVMPAVIPAEGYLVASACGAGNADRDRIRLTTCSRKPRHIRPGMHGNQPFRQCNFLMAVQC